MVEPFEAAVFALEPGTYSPEPVQTQFGYHLIYLTELTQTAPDSFEAMEEQLRSQLEEEIQTRVREELRSGADYSITPYAELDRIEEGTGEETQTTEEASETEETEEADDTPAETAEEDASAEGATEESSDSETAEE